MILWTNWIFRVPKLVFFLCFGQFVDFFVKNCPRTRFAGLHPFSCLGIAYRSISKYIVFIIRCSGLFEYLIKPKTSIENKNIRVVVGIVWTFVCTKLSIINGKSNIRMFIFNFKTSFSFCPDHLRLEKVIDSINVNKLKKPWCYVKRERKNINEVKLRNETWDKKTTKILFFLLQIYNFVK